MRALLHHTKRAYLVVFTVPERILLVPYLDDLPCTDKDMCINAITTGRNNYLN